MLTNDERKNAVNALRKPGETCICDGCTDMLRSRAETLRAAAVEAVKNTYTDEGVVIWWADHDRQTPEEQARRQRMIVTLADGGIL